jgi:hypothetical protein
MRLFAIDVEHALDERDLDDNFCAISCGCCPGTVNPETLVYVNRGYAYGEVETRNSSSIGEASAFRSSPPRPSRMAGPLVAASKLAVQ